MKMAGGCLRALKTISRARWEQRASRTKLSLGQTPPTTRYPETSGVQGLVKSEVSFAGVSQASHNTCSGLQSLMGDMYMLAENLVSYFFS